MSSATIHNSHPIQPAKSARRESRFFTIGFVAFCLSTIAVVSATDIWFAVVNSSIMVDEKNPICLALMKLYPHGFSFFIFGKSIGTLVVILTLLQLNIRNYQHAMKITIVVTCFQLGLLTYLTLSDPLTYNLPNFGLLFDETPECIWRVN